MFPGSPNPDKPGNILTRNTPATPMPDEAAPDDEYNRIGYNARQSGAASRSSCF